MSFLDLRRKNVPSDLASGAVLGLVTIPEVIGERQMGPAGNRDPSRMRSATTRGH